MAEVKTKKNNASVEAFLNSVEDEKKRKDSYAIVELIKEVTGYKPAMWGPSIVGFGSYRYKYASGREGDWMITGFSPRKQNLTFYIMSGFDRYDELLSELGKYSKGKGCLYVKKIEDINLDVLRALVKSSVEHMAQNHELST